MAALPLLASEPAAPGGTPALADAWRIISSKRFVDLTHSFEPGIPHWAGFPDEKRESVYWYEAAPSISGTGFFAQVYTHIGQWGTHVDPPAHFHKGLRTVDRIEVQDMILPLVVLDIHARVATNADTVVRPVDVQAWEAAHGRIPARAFVALRTDWSKCWPDAKAMANKDAQGTAHYPGWSAEVLKFLYEERGITASGHETTDTDPGLATTKDDYALESYVLKHGWQIELLANLDQVPPAGALAVVTFPKPKGGSGFPARVFAILP
ncbi:MAG: cyclase family protein [Kiritimatiellae bacterium]|nr:cyclase family protein [Kiritimatiellia bacterium]